jgi:hypothetical protein
VRQLVLSVVMEELLERYDCNYSTRCLQASVGAQLVLDVPGMGSLLPCIPNTAIAVTSDTALERRQRGHHELTRNVLRFHPARRVPFPLIPRSGNAERPIQHPTYTLGHTLRAVSERRQVARCEPAASHADRLDRPDLR